MGTYRITQHPILDIVDKAEAFLDKNEDEVIPVADKIDTNTNNDLKGLPDARVGIDVLCDVENPLLGREHAGRFHARGPITSTPPRHLRHRLHPAAGRRWAGPAARSH